MNSSVYEIDFIQYLLPDGRQTPVQFICSNAQTAKLAQEILATGRYRLECEVLRTGMCSFTVFDIKREEDIAIELSSNGPAVIAAVDKLMAEAHKIIFNPTNQTA